MNLGGAARYCTGMNARYALWRYEVGRAGWPALLSPALVMAGLVGFGALMSRTGSPDATVARFLQSILEGMLPLAAGLGAAALVGRDPAVELQLTLPTSYRSTLLRRLAVTVTWSALLAVVLAVGLAVTGWWDKWPGHRLLPGQLVWLAPLAALTALGAAVAVAARSAAVASGVLSGAWLIQQIFQPWFAGRGWTHPLYLFFTTRLNGPGWTQNRVTLLVVALLLFAAAGAMLGRPERLLTEEDS